MRFNIGKKVLCFAFLAVALSISSSAQMHIRYAVPSDLGAKILFSDHVLPSITLPRGVSRVDDNQYVRDAAFELMDILRNPEIKLLSVYVCGSASPDGLWQNNVELSQARTSAAAKYLNHVTGLPVELIHQKSLNEDWDRLYEMIEASDIDHKEQVLDIIRTMDWGDRKLALQRLDGGKVWRVLLDDFFPQLRCVRIAFYCLWDPSKPYLKEPEKCDVKPEPKEVISRVDTVYVKDTVFYMKETIYMPQMIEEAEEAGNDAYEEYREGNMNPRHDTPWMMGFKTNLLSDGIAVPDFGVEFQIAKRVSLNISGWHTYKNIFHPDSDVNSCGVSPELRWWIGDRPMQKGHFLGVHGNFVYNPVDLRRGNILNPAWSAGLTYGYSLGFGRKGHWGLEFFAGLGYINSAKSVGNWSEVLMPTWYYPKNDEAMCFGITKLGINLTYRFSLRRVNPEYYDR